MRPSSVPIQISLSLRGESAMVKMVPNPHGLAFARLISPSQPVVPGTAPVRSGLTTVQVWPRSVDRKRTCAAWYSAWGGLFETASGVIHV